MDSSRARIDQLRKSLDVGREQLFNSPILQYGPNYRVAVGEHLQILLVRTELFGLGLLGIRVDLQPVEQGFTKLSGRVDVQRGVAAHFTDGVFQFDSPC